MGDADRTDKTAERRRYAPIAVFAYRRTDMLARTLDTLEACPEFAHSDVYVYSDGQKSLQAASDVEGVRALVRSRLRPNMKLIEAPQNRGLANSVIAGVTELCEKYGRVIVIEDDLVVSPVILTWFNEALDRYVDEPRVMQVSGHIFNSKRLALQERAAFLPFITSWGWATWKRAWDLFDIDAQGWQNILQDMALRRRFDLGDVYPYSQMLRRQISGEIDSWAIRFYLRVFQSQGVALFPSRSFVVNDGTDGRASHSNWKRRILNWLSVRAPVAMQIGHFPDEVVVDEAAFRLVRLAIARSRLFIPPSVVMIFRRNWQTGSLIEK